MGYSISRSTANFSGSSEAECKQGVARRNRNVLHPVHGISDRRGGDLGAEVTLPKFLARPGVEREEISFPVARKQQIAGRRENPGVADIAHLVIPDFLASGRIYCPHHAISPLGPPFDEGVPAEGLKRRPRSPARE